MIHQITRGALRLDLWLQARLGRPYNFVLGAGLAVEIGRRLVEAPHRVTSMHRLAGSILVVLLELALLIHQVGALAHHTAPRSPKLVDEADAD